MAVRILHTSDWHLGVSINSQRCEAEQRRFLGWLADEIEERAIDVLVVAGDVFHYATPSNTAREMYYDFLVDCAAISSLEQVVIVGGNHDSPTGLDAPRELLGSLDVHVVGGLPYDEEARLERCLVPIGEGPELVVAAVPYARRAQLGVALDDESGRSVQVRYQEAFEEMYQALASAAERRFPGVPRVATGHLTCYAPSNELEEGDYHSAIHGTADTRDVDTVGNIGAMPPSIFGDDYAYVALGHIHRRMRVGDGDVWYSGTPVATSLGEATERHVLQIDIETDGTAAVESIAVPTWRRLLTFEGSEEAIAEELDNIERTAPLPPYLFFDIELAGDEQTYKEPEEQLRGRLEEMFPDADERPRIVAARTFDPAAVDVEPADEVPSLEDLSDREVFIQRFQSKVGTDDDPPEELLDAFDEIRQAYHDTDGSTA